MISANLIWLDVYYNFFYVGPPKEDIFLTTFYSLYFNQQVHIITDNNSCWASEGNFHVLFQLLVL